MLAKPAARTCGLDNIPAGLPISRLRAYIESGLIGVAKIMKFVFFKEVLGGSPIDRLRKGSFKHGIV